MSKLSLFLFAILLTQSVSAMSRLPSGESSHGFLRFSDQDLKFNIAPVEDPLDKINKINGVQYQWIATNKKEIGVIAQEIAQVFPELVKTSDSGFMQVNYAGLIGVLVESIKALQQENKAIRQQLQMHLEK